MMMIAGMRVTFSTLITCVRIILIPFIILYMMHHAWGNAFVLFFVAAFTDILDGMLARLLNEQTKLGAYLDPVADKLLIVSCLTALVYVQPHGLVVPAWLVIIILIKELLLVCGIFGARIMGLSLEIKPTIFGKSAMFVQVLFVGWLFACYYFEWMPSKTFFVVILLVIFMVVASLVDYIAYGVRGLSRKVKIR